MIELIESLPDNVVGFTARGEVTARDYTDVLDPAISAAIARHDRIRVLYVLGSDFTGYTEAAMWEDAIEGTEHFSHWDRVAVVTDEPWVRHSVNAFAWMMPARMRLFPDAEQAAAVEWICGP